MSGTTIYCAKCRENHHLTATEAEAVIATLVAEWAAAATSDERDGGFDASDTGDAVTCDWCAVYHLTWIYDGETYGEHIESMREARQATTKEQP